MKGGESRDGDEEEGCREEAREEEEVSLATSVKMEESHRHHERR